MERTVVSKTESTESRIDKLLLESVTDQRLFRYHGLQKKVVLVTGAAGFIGSEIVKQLVFSEPARVVMVDQAETPLHDLLTDLRLLKTNVEIRAWLGSITDDAMMERLFLTEQPDVVFHAAAYKHLYFLEDQPAEAFKTNVLGTRIVTKLAISHGVEKFILISTDKAVKPTSVLGMTKKLAELYVRSCESVSGTKCVILRFGNVINSGGSVVKIFEKQIAAGGPITVSHPKAARHFMTVYQACQLVLEASIAASGGELLVLDMGEPVPILKLAEVMARRRGLEPQRDIQIIFSGLKKGEKLIEDIREDHEFFVESDFPQVRLVKTLPLEFELLEMQLQKLQFSSIQYLSPEELVAEIKNLLSISGVNCS